MNKDEALDKVRKLLNTNGRTHEEAETAQILAGAIAAKHGIDIAALDSAEAARQSMITDIEVGAWINEKPMEARCAALICEDHFEISSIAIRHRHCGASEVKLHFVGTEHHLEIATYVFDFLLREFRWQWRHKRGRIKKRPLFMWGVYCGLAAKLGDRSAPKPVATTAGNELEISWKNRRAAYIRNKWGETESKTVAPKEKGGAAMWQGFKAGGDIEIRPGVDAGDAREHARLGAGQKFLCF